MKTNPQIQFASLEEIKQYQEALLREQIIYLAKYSPFYQKLFAREKINPSLIRRIEDLSSIPTTSKTDLQNQNEQFLCVPRSEISDFVTTSGTLGEPVTFAVTNSDLERLAYNEELSFSTAGCRPGDIFQLMTTIDRRFMAGLAYFLGARKLGCGVARVGNGIPELQWDTIRRIQPSVCIVVPSFLLKLVQYAQSHGIDPQKSSLRRAICIGEALRSPGPDYHLSTLGERITQQWPGLELFSTYASTEMQTSFTECSQHAGGHIPPELIIVELLDEQEQPVSENTPGEVTITTLGVQGMPLLRFKTGDICCFTSEPCRCGRNTPRLSSLLGRKKQMIKYKGTTLYPPALFNILNEISGIQNYIIDVSTNELDTDSITLRIASPRQDEAFIKEIKDLFRSRIRVAPEIIFESSEKISSLQFPPMSRKPIFFRDLRKPIEILK